LSANGSTVLAHHFEDLGQQHDAATLGMWVFLATELMVFGGLFAGYTVYRVSYPESFEQASQHLNIVIAAVNTVVLLTSSLTMALGVWAVQVGRSRTLTYCLIVTALLGTTFLVIKVFEYYGDYRDKLVPGLSFDVYDWVPKQEKYKAPDISPNLEPADRTMPVEVTVAFGERVKLFFAFYYIMTGLHAVHLIVGVAILAVLAVQASRGRFTPEYYSPVEVAGLYWHFVDVVWIILLPILYLVGTLHWSS
jgi:cytochrome c oxidase subunit III